MGFFVNKIIGHMIKTKKTRQITSLLYYKAGPKGNVVTISFNVLVGSRKIVNAIGTF